MNINLLAEFISYAIKRLHRTNPVKCYAFRRAAECIKIIEYPPEFEKFWRTSPVECFAFHRGILIHLMRRGRVDREKHYV